MQSQGFSLLELLIVIAIGAILAAIGIGQWKDMQKRNELTSTTHELMRFFNEVKKDANLYNDTHTIYLFNDNSSNWCLAVAKDSKPSSCQTKFRFIPNTKQVAIAGLSANSTLIFYGHRSMAKPGTIRLQNDIGESRIIVSIQGRIRYCSYNTYLSGFNPC